MEAYTISERKYRRKLQSESYFPVIILYSRVQAEDGSVVCESAGDVTADLRGLRWWSASNQTD